ncbi:MAG: nitroreductase family deazaflavin-dependent oxidoreductase [Acidimicrobiia bacterium]|nr:nitroreductase family deazaflavin-dependent oxidoreductase [Acidimicrobiia bacterium]
MTDERQQMDDVNAHVIEDFRTNNGSVEVAMGGFFAGKPVLILHTTGAKTGKERLNPLVYATHDRNYVVAASKGGSPHHPHWFLNVKANPDVTVEVGDEQFRAKATIVEDGPYRDELYAKLATIMVQFAEYETKTDRRIPVIVLERAR